MHVRVQAWMCTCHVLHAGWPVLVLGCTLKQCAPSCTRGLNAEQAQAVLAPVSCKLAVTCYQSLLTTGWK